MPSELERLVVALLQPRQDNAPQQFGAQLVTQYETLLALSENVNADYPVPAPVWMPGGDANTMRWGEFVWQ